MFLNCIKQFWNERRGNFVSQNNGGGLEQGRDSTEPLPDSGQPAPSPAELLRQEFKKANDARDFLKFMKVQAVFDDICKKAKLPEEGGWEKVSDTSKKILIESYINKGWDTVRDATLNGNQLIVHLNKLGVKDPALITLQYGDITPGAPGQKPHTSAEKPQMPKALERVFADLARQSGREVRDLTKNYNHSFLDYAFLRGDTNFVIVSDDRHPTDDLTIHAKTSTGGDHIIIIPRKGEGDATEKGAIKEDIREAFARPNPQELAENQKSYNDLVAKWKDRADRITERDKGDLMGVLKEQLRDALFLDPEFLKLFETDTAGNIRFDDSGMPMFKKGGDVTDIMMNTHWGIAESFAREIGIADEEEIKQFCHFIMFN